MDTRTKFKAAGVAADLDQLTEWALESTSDIIEKNDIPSAVVHFDEFRDAVREIAEKVALLQKQVDGLSYELLPTMFTNQNVKSIKVDGVGMTTVVVRWNASMVDRAKGLDWLRETGNGGLIIETVNANTLASWAKEETLAGRTPPAEIFKVGTAPHISIRKG